MAKAIKGVDKIIKARSRHSCGPGSDANDLFDHIHLSKNNSGACRDQEIEETVD